MSSNQSGGAKDLNETDKSPKSRNDRHMHQVDLFRLVTFGGVILDHVVSGTTLASNVTAHGFALLLHYTRYGFFWLTGFVLTCQYRDRDLRPVEFWKRRYKLIGLPYLTWSVFYFGFSLLLGQYPDETLRARLIRLVIDLCSGQAWYHMYFIFVTMQIYLVFPAVLWVLKRTRGYHWLLLVISGMFHVWMVRQMTQPMAFWHSNLIFENLYSHLINTLLPYQFFILGGMVCAMHYEKLQAFFMRFRLAIIAAALLVIVAAELYYLRAVDSGESPLAASNVFLLHFIPVFAAVIAGLYALGCVWRARRRDGSGAAKVMSMAADRSFGIYLAHALALQAIAPIINKVRFTYPSLLVASVTFVITVLLTLVIVEVLRRSPLSLITTGRPMLRPTAPLTATG